MVPLFAFGQIWVPILAAVFLGEVFRLSIYGGITLIVVGSFLILWKPQSGLPYSWRVLAAMAGSTLGYASYSIVLKYLLGFYPFWAVIGYVMIGEAILATVLLFRHWGDAKKTAWKVWSIIAGEEGLNVLGVLLFASAASVGFITFVDAASASQHIFIFLFGILVSRFFPRVFKEDLTSRLVALKLFAMLLIIGGVVWIALHS